MNFIVSLGGMVAEISNNTTYLTAQKGFSYKLFETTNMKKNRPKVGVGVVVIKNGKVLLGKRKNAHGEGTWSFPGGHLEFNEEIKDCAIREVKEETGIEIKNIRMGTFTNDIFKKEEKHYVTLFVVSDYSFGEVKVMEPEKCERWDWFEWDKLPQPLFVPIQNLQKRNYNPLNSS